MPPPVCRVAVLGGNRTPFARADGPYATLAKLLHQRAEQESGTVRGLVSICAAGGQGSSAVLER